MQRKFNNGTLSKNGEGSKTLRIVPAESVFGRLGAANYLCLVARGQQHALTLIELLFAVTIIGIIIAVGIPMYQSYIDRTKVAQAESDIQSIGFLISHFQVANGAFPNTLADVNNGGRLDPWGRPYRYFNLTTLTGNGMVRKDKNMVPINSDFDLYSVGKDGKTKSPLTATVSRDDIIRASNGRFVGLASDY